MRFTFVTRCKDRQISKYASVFLEKFLIIFPIMNNRIKQIIDYLNLTTSGFEKKIGTSNGQISKQLARNSAIKSDILAKILEICPNINANWLITGRGEMLLQEQKQEKQEQKTPPPVADDTQLQRLQDLLEAKQETISVLQETNNNLLSEIQQLRNYVNVTSTKYIQMVEQTLAAATDTRSKINEIQVGFNAYHQSLAPSKHKITSHHTPKTK